MVNYSGSSHRVAEIMSTNPWYIYPEATLSEVLNTFNSKRIGSLAVIANDKIVGIITRFDLGKYRSSSFHQIKVRTAMSPNPVIISEDTTIEDAKDMMFGRRFGRQFGSLLVGEGGRLTGIVTRFDIRRFENTGVTNPPPPPPPPHKPVAQPSANKLLEGRYELINKIKTGGMAIIWKASDLKSGGTCIVKQAKNDPDPETRKLFDDKLAMERAFLCQWHHPNIVRYKDYFTDKGDSYLVVEFIDGQDLFDAFKHSPANEATALGLADQMLKVLEFLHAQGLVHRDFNPGNMMLRPDGQLVVIDFGTIKAGGTQGTTICKPGFNIPELVARGYSDARSDIYGAGATLFYILTCQPPGLSGATKPVDYLVNRGVTVRTATCIQQALNIEPEHRFKDAATMRAALLS